MFSKIGNFCNELPRKYFIFLIGIFGIIKNVINSDEMKLLMRCELALAANFD